MQLNHEEQAMLAGHDGFAVRKSIEILAALGKIYGADRLIPVSSVQISGVSFDNLGEAGLNFLTEMAEGSAQTKVLTTLNPAGMDVDAPDALGISPEFARDQQRVLDAFARMGVITTCTCTPYLVGNTPHFGEHIAWAESSAVCFANSVLGARTNREGGPSALAAALTGLTPAYGLHLEEKRHPTVTVDVQADLRETSDFGALGIVIGRKAEQCGRKGIPYITGVQSATLEQLKSFCASVATYGGLALFHIPGITPEASQYTPPLDCFRVTQQEIEAAQASLCSPDAEPVDFVSLGCPHLSLAEIAHLADLLRGKKVQKTFWITTARPTKQIADRMGYSQTIEASGAIFAVDTCCVVAPIAGRFHTLVTDSAKACYYASSKNRSHTILRSFDEVVAEALR